jgi:hypothetical protein
MAMVVVVKASEMEAEAVATAQAYSLLQTHQNMSVSSDKPGQH